MTTLLEKFNKEQLKDLPELRPGDTIKVYQKISAEGGSTSGGKENKGERIQIFEGVIIAKKHGKGISATITVRKITNGIGVEKIFPIHSPSISKIEVLRHGKVRRAKLYYLKTAMGKKARLKRKDFATAITEESVEELETEETTNKNSAKKEETFSKNSTEQKLTEEKKEK